jgi:CRISPR/Cas system-associated exonuclease Cas4 (RecB family)
MTQFNLVAQTDAWMTRKRIQRPSKGTFYPSEASAAWTDKNGVRCVSGACMRSAWYRVTGKADEGALPTDAYSEWIFALGKGVEEILVEQWKQMGLWVANNVQFYDKERNISGEADVILTDPTTGQLILIEVKSFHAYYATKEICGNRSTKGQPKTSHMMQLLIYLDQFKDTVAPVGKLIYYARDSGNRAEFDVSLTEDNGVHYPTVDGVVSHRFTLEDIYSRYAELKQHVDEDQIPLVDYQKVWESAKIEDKWKLGEISKTAYQKWQKNPDKNPIGDWQCNYCKFRNECWRK